MQHPKTVQYVIWPEESAFPETKPERRRRSSLRQTFSLIAESESSLGLQMALHYNVCFMPLSIIGAVASLIIKFGFLSSTYQVILVAAYFIFFTVEAIRLFLGFYGNLAENIPAMSGFWITTLVLQLPISLFLQLNSAIYPLPIDRALFAINTIFLVVQLSFGAIVMRSMADKQIAQLKKLLEAMDQPT